MLDAALAYAQSGYPVLPLHNPENGGCSCHKKDCSKIGKHPRTLNGLTDATVDAEKITQWWTMWPQANIGLATGAVSGSAWIDIDPRHGGTESIKSLQARHGKFVERFVQKTGGDGWHLGFKHPGFRVGNIQSTADRPGALGLGVDVRGDGGYIVAAPSLHISGKRYQFPKPLNGNLPEMPEWLKMILQSTPKQAAGAIAGDIREGQRNNTLASLAGSMRRRNMSVEAILSALRTENETRCSPPLSDDEVARIVESVSRYEPEPDPSADRGASREKSILEAASNHKNDSAGQPRVEFEPQTDSGLKIVRMADVEPEAVEWLWEPYIALGKLALLEGDPGVGKSWVTAALAAAVSRGRGLAGMEITEPANVLMLTAEDGLADTLRPRLDAVRADVSRVLALNEPLTFDGPGLLRLEVAIIEHKPILVTVDPLFAFTGGKVDIHRANECRTVTARLAAIAEKHGCALIAIRHLGKSRGMGHSLNAGIGSIDLVASARSVLLAGKDPDDENKRAIVQIKSNLAPHGPAVGFTLRGGEFFWTGESDLTDARILSYAPSESERPALDEATEFLRDELSDGDCDVATLKANARRAGIQEITLRRAKERLGVKAKKVGGYFGNKPAHWVWLLPDAEDAHGDAEDAHKIDDERLQASGANKASYSNGLAEGSHGNNYEHLQEGDEHLQGGLGHENYVEPTTAEWAEAASSPEAWARLVELAERNAIEHEEALA